MLEFLLNKLKTLEQKLDAFPIRISALQRVGMDASDVQKEWDNALEEWEKLNARLTQLMGPYLN